MAEVELGPSLLNRVDISIIINCNLVFLIDLDWISSSVKVWDKSKGPFTKLSFKTEQMFQWTMLILFIQRKSGTASAPVSFHIFKMDELT